MITSAARAFHDALPEGGRLLGLDLGAKTIGAALCDAGWSFATPAHTIARGKFAADKAAIEALMSAQQVQGIVLGLPLHLDGAESPRSQSARAFARNIEDLGKPILLWDERFSTVAAERALIAADWSRAKRAERIDAHAAAHILQGAIDGLCAL